MGITALVANMKARENLDIDGMYKNEILFDSAHMRYRDISNEIYVLKIGI